MKKLFLLMAICFYAIPVGAVTYDITMAVDNGTGSMQEIPQEEAGGQLHIYSPLFQSPPYGYGAGRRMLTP